MTDKHHPKPCLCCGVGTYRSDGYCRRCHSERTFKIEELSEALLLRCAQELLRRHRERDEALRALGLVPVRAA